jgi:hypothetical protein
LLLASLAGPSAAAVAEVGAAEGHEPPAAVEEVVEDTAFDQLSDREVALAVEGGRDFEVVSAFGSLRYEGCTVLVVEEELGEAGRRLAESLRKRAEKIRRVRGIDVFVFRDRTVMESTYEAKAWQGTFVALPKPNVVLCARSDGYLEELLARTMNDQVHGRALPRELPEWNYVDTSSAMWAIRHIPTESPGQVVSGLAWSLNPKGRSLLEVVYLEKTMLAPRRSREFGPNLRSGLTQRSWRNARGPRW